MLPLVQVIAALLLSAVLFVVVMYETDDVSARIEEAGLLLVAALGFRALWLWLRPLPVVPPCAEDRDRATELVHEHGTDSLAYFALRRDKSYFFAPSGRSFLAYRVIGSTALVAGDPIGEAQERGELMSEFVRVAHTKGWRVAIAGASNEALEDYTAIGFKSMYLGDEAVIRPSEFSLDGRAIRKVRQSVSRLKKSGYEVRMLSTADADDHLRAELRAVSEEWRGAWPERGFTMAMDALFRYPDTVLAVAVGPGGAVGGFLQLVPSPASEGYSLSSMRRRKDTPNGLMEYLITEAVGWARAHHVTEVSLNFAVFADFLHADEDAGALTRARPVGALEGRSPVPGRAPPQLQPQVLPALAPALLLLRALERPAARRTGLPSGRVTAHSARPVGQVAGSGRALRWLALVLVLFCVAVTGASARTASLGIVKVGHFESPVYVTSTPSEPGKLYVVEQAGRIMVRRLDDPVSRHTIARQERG